jgi:transposase-like protein
LKTPLSQIVLILQALNEGLGVNAVCRLFRVSKNSLYRWQERLSDLKPTARVVCPLSSVSQPHGRRR